MSKINYYTPEGLQNLKDQLYELKTVQRPSISQQIGEARDKGDLSENAEYDAAKEAQGLHELKISQLEETLSKAVVLKEESIDTSKVTALCKVKIMNLKMKREFTYTLVSESEADIKQNKISVGSPIGKGLLGHKIGEVVDIQVPNGVMKFEILDISI